MLTIVLFLAGLFPLFAQANPAVTDANREAVRTGGVPVLV